MKKIFLGILIGFALSLSATAFAESVKQYILTKVSYPIFVNGQEYKDEKLPALNYEGNTYIPLAKIGDILGVDYRWNAEKNRVEIGKLSEDDTPAATPSSSGSTIPDFKYVREEPSQPETPSVEEVIQGIERFWYNQLPEEEKIFKAIWIGEWELDRKYGIMVSPYFNSITDVELWFRTYVPGEGHKTIYKIYNVPDRYGAGSVVTNNGIRYMYQKETQYRRAGLYFNREDLRNLGIIP